MGDYARVEDVERLMAQFVLTNSTKPNQLQVDSIIEDTESEVISLLDASRVKFPIEEGRFKRWIGLVVSYGATAAILKSMFPGVSGPSETPAYAFWESRYRNALKGIIDGSLIPPSIARLPIKQAKPSTYFTRNPSREEYLGDIAEPFFKRGGPL